MGYFVACFAVHQIELIGGFFWRIRRELRVPEVREIAQHYVFVWLAKVPRARVSWIHVQVFVVFEDGVDRGVVIVRLQLRASGFAALSLALAVLPCLFDAEKLV